MDALFSKIGLITGIILPFFNIPLIVRIVRRKSSKDISLTWAWGVWICILLMAPSSFRSPDLNFRVFSIINLLFFSCVMFVTLKYRRGNHGT